MFPKSENTQILRFRYIFNAPAAMFLSVAKGCLCQLPQAVTPTSNIALLILCSRQAIVPLCRPGGVRAARFNKGRGAPEAGRPRTIQKDSSRGAIGAIVNEMLRRIFENHTKT